jgi:hypothetical protein
MYTDNVHNRHCADIAAAKLLARYSADKHYKLHTANLWDSEPVRGNQHIMPFQTKLATNQRQPAYAALFYSTANESARQNA